VRTTKIKTKNDTKPNVAFKSISFFGFKKISITLRHSILERTGYANYNVSSTISNITQQKNVFEFMAIGVFFDSSLNKPNLHLFTRNLMRPMKLNHVLG
jgi:hypothetical protein